MSKFYKLKIKPDGVYNDMLINLEQIVKINGNVIAFSDGRFENVSNADLNEIKKLLKIT